MSIFKNEKFQKIFYPVFYILFAIAVSISGCFIFSRYYYTNIFVSGPSMQPTLIGEKNVHHYGIADTSDAAINGLKRFDVVIARFPKEWKTTTDLVVKRIWGFPGETITMVSSDTKSTFTATSGDVTYTITAEVEYRKADLIYKVDEEAKPYYKFVTPRKSFYTNTAEKRNFSVTLKENQYFIMGDNWGQSSDSYAKVSEDIKLSRDDLKGRVVCIQGYGRVDSSSGEDKIVDKVKIRPMYNF